jgi:hypothetical protein
MRFCKVKKIHSFPTQVNKMEAASVFLYAFPKKGQKEKR